MTVRASSRASSRRMAPGATAMQPSVGGKAGRGDVQEDGAAGALQRAGEVVVEDDDHVVEAVVAPQAFVAAGIGQADRAVVAAVGGVVAPAVVRPERPGGQRVAGGGRRSARQ